MPSGIEAEGYEGTRFRRWEIYQVKTIRAGLRALGVQKVGDLDPSNPKHENAAARFLVTGLVGPEKPGAQTLFRPGARGINRVKNEIDTPELIEAFGRQLLFSRVVPA